MFNRHLSNHRFSQGFTLVELLVVVAIVALLSVSAVVGFGSLGNSLRAEQTTGFLEDVVKREELKVLRGDFSKVVIHFMSYFLVIEEWPENAVEGLALGELCTTSSDDYNIDFKKSGNLTLKNGDGEVLEVKGVNKDASECANFKNASDLEWTYELSGQDPAYDSLHFAQFNLDRENLQNTLQIVRNAGSKVEILSPYGKKRYFRWIGNTFQPSEGLEIEVGNSDQSILKTVIFR